jgi:hypothetical protein
MTTPVTSKSFGKHQVFDPWGFDDDGTSDPTQTPPRGIYVPGQPKGYAEGDTAAFLVDMTLQEGDYTTIIELDLFTGGAYAFLGLEDWDTTFQFAGTDFPAPPPEAGDLLVDSVDGVNMTNATIGDTGDGFGDADGVTYLGTFFSGGTWTQRWEVNFTVDDGDEIPNEELTVYMVYGGHIAAPGDVITDYVTANDDATDFVPVVDADGDSILDSEVPDGFGASNVSGVFQARISGDGGDKTVNFKGDLIAVAEADVWLINSVN